MPANSVSDSLSPWLRLSLEPGLAPARLRALLKHAGPAENVYALPDKALAALAGADLARQMRAPPGERLQGMIDSALAWAERSGNHLLTWGDAAYPPLLLETHDPPPLLYVMGDLACLRRPSVAVVGARNATPGGLDNARAFARYLATEGWCVVSGLASGIDAAAHEGALEAGAEGAGTVAVIGTGADIVYPKRNKALAHRIASGGAIMSEFALGMPAMPHQFPRRNRLVAGLARGVLVVEAALHSGSLITARLAGDLGREVFAVPGSIHSPLSRGCHALIRQGAKLTETGEDILSELGAGGASAVRVAKAQAAPAAGLFDEHDAMVQSTGLEREDCAGAAADAVLRGLGHDPVHIDDLQRRLKMAGPDVLARLLALELAGKVVRLTGGRYQQR